jgi:hypothetical protein
VFSFSSGLSLPEVNYSKNFATMQQPSYDSSFRHERALPVFPDVASMIRFIAAFCPTPVELVDGRLGGLL